MPTTDYTSPSANAAIPNGVNMGSAYGGQAFSPTQVPAPSPVSVPTTIDASKFNNVTPLSVPQGVPTSYGAFIRSLQSVIPQEQAGIDQEQSAVDRQLQDLMSSNAELGNKGAYQQSLESQYGVPETQRQIADLNTQLARRTAEFNTQYQAVEGQGFDQSLVSGIQALNRSKAAVELGNLASVQQALQGNLAGAVSLAERTTNLKYEPMEAALKNKLLFYQENKDKLSAKQARLADKQKTVIDAQLKNIESAKQDARQLNSDTLSLLKEGKLTGEQASDILSGKTNLFSALKNTGVNTATIGTDPLSSLQTIIKNGGAKTDDKLKLTGAVIAATQKVAELNSTGDFAGLGPIRAGALTVSQKGQNNRSYLSGLKGTVESWMTGASVSEEQQKRIKEDLVPNESDTDKQVRQKVNALTNYMLDYASGNLATQGVNYRPTQVDLFTVKTDPLSLGIDLTSANSNPLGI